jgi:hypothetical protein
MLTSVSLGARISKMDDSATRVLPQIVDLDIFHLFMIFDVKWPDSRPLDPQTPECRNPDTTPSRLSLCYSVHEGLNLMQLSTDPMVVCFFIQDMMVQIMSSPCAFPTLPEHKSTVQILSADLIVVVAPHEIWCFLPKLGRISNSQRPQPLFIFLVSSSS